MLEGSQDFAQKLTDKLEDEVYDALEMIAQGFLDYRRNRLQPNPATLRTIYEQSLVLLYRLLFIFYAESREILPLHRNDAYTSAHSLHAIKREVANKLHFRAELHPDSDVIYNQLRLLFFAIDAGDERLDLPPYNGRLFSDREHPFLADHAVGDAYLAPALDKLARVDDNGQRVFVDYRDLEVRHLGSIYEKLLEYELDIAREPLTLKGREQRYAPAKPGDEIVKQPGQVFLRTGSHERKITGSYYTPDYIVRFIVEKTLEPLLRKITERHATVDEEGNWHILDGEALIQDLLALNVLDPATGSGHFVVDVTAYIAEWMRELPLRPADIEDEDELLYWRRVVASACIYAVDINPLAVELAKLSMWLTTLARGKPLSFLDHHIRVGNSLVGTRISAIDDREVDIKQEQLRRKRLAKVEKEKREAEAAGQLAMFSDANFGAGVRFAVQQMNAIEGTVPDRVDDVKHQEQLYAELTERLGVWQQAADVWSARYFGLELTEDQWQAVQRYATSGMIPPALQPILDRAAALAAEHRFFHWELAFPEIFFDVDGQPKADAGFDAVVGNPPYVRQERIQPIKPYLQAHYDVYSGTADLFLYFYERGLEHLKPEHRLGYITSGTYMNSNSARAFRQYIHENAAFVTLVDFGAVQPFRGVDLPTNVMIAVLRRTREKALFRSLFFEGRARPTSLDEALENEGFDTLPGVTAREEWRFQPRDLSELFQKLSQGTTALSEVTRGLAYGIKTGFNDAFIIDGGVANSLIEQHASSKELIRPLARGQDLRPWYQSCQDQYLILTRHGIDIDSYPAVLAYLRQFQRALEPMPLNWDRRKQGTWQGRKSGPYEWYEIQDPVLYHREFDGPKVLFPDIAKFPRFSWDAGGLYCNDKGSIILTDRFSILGILNSRVTWFAFSQIGTPLAIRKGLWRYQAKLQFIERLPIPELTADQESNLAAIAEQITGLARDRYAHHEDVRRTILTEFDGDEISTRVALYRWWEFEDEKALSDEIKTRFGQEILLRKRGEWRKFLAEQKAEHQRLTDQIIAFEVRMNDIVYDAFDLTPAERHLIEEATKYPYGEV